METIRAEQMKNIYTRFVLAVCCSFGLAVAVVSLSLAKVCAKGGNPSLGECPDFSIPHLILDLGKNIIAPIVVVVHLAGEVFFQSGVLRSDFIEVVGVVQTMVLVGCLTVLFLASMVVALRLVDPIRSFLVLSFTLLLWFFFSWCCCALFLSPT